MLFLFVLQFHDITERENIGQNLLNDIYVKFLHYFDVYENM